MREILATHAGSLVRPPTTQELWGARAEVMA